MTAARSRSTRGLAAQAHLAIHDPYEMRLYIAGMTPLSAAAISNVLAICSGPLKDRHRLVVIDVYQDPARAKADQIVAVPTLLRMQPLPPRRLIGDLSDRAKVMAGLDLPEASLDHATKT